MCIAFNPIPAGPLELRFRPGCVNLHNLFLGVILGLGTPEMVPNPISYRDLHDTTKHQPQNHLEHASSGITSC